MLFQDITTQGHIKSHQCIGINSRASVLITREQNNFPIKFLISPQFYFEIWHLASHHDNSSAKTVSFGSSGHLVQVKHDTKRGTLNTLH